MTNALQGEPTTEPPTQQQTQKQPAAASVSAAVWSYVAASTRRRCHVQTCFMAAMLVVTIVAVYSAGKTQAVSVTPPACRVGRFNAKNTSATELWIHRGAVHRELEEAWNAHLSAAAKSYYVVLGAAGQGKTSAILSWLNGRDNAISVHCDRESNADAVWHGIGQALGGCSGDAAKMFVQHEQPHLIIHLHVGGKKVESPVSAGSAFVSDVGKNWAAYAMLILDLSPRSVNVGLLPPQGSRFSPLHVPEFSLDEARAYVERAGRVVGARFKFDGDSAGVIKLVGRNPLALHTWVVANNMTSAQLRRQFEEKRESAQKTLLQFVKRRDKAAVEELSAVAAAPYDLGVPWKPHAISYDNFHLFPMLRAGLVGSTLYLYYASTVDHEAYKELCDDALKQFVDVVWVHPRTGSGPPFSVTPTANDIDHLKKAIKAEIDVKYPTLIAPDTTIYAPNEAHGDVAVVLPGGAKTKYKKVLDPRELLMRNNGKDDPPYLFELRQARQQRMCIGEQ
jgi:hypothetical protein